MSGPRLSGPCLSGPYLSGPFYLDSACLSISLSISLLQCFAMFWHFGGLQAFGGVPGEDFDPQNSNPRPEMTANSLQQGKKEENRGLLPSAYFKGVLLSFTKRYIMCFI